MSNTPHSTSWDDFRLVRVIAEMRSLTGAADRLGLNHSTVFRRLGHLEETLGTRLFERSRNGYAATVAGEEMVALAAHMGEAIDAFERRAAGRDEKPSGELRITTTDSMLQYMLTPILAGFAKAYPDIRLELIIGAQQLNLSRRDAEIAIRASAEPSETLVGRRIADIAWCRYGPDRADFNCNDPAARWVGFADNMASLPAARLLETEVGAARIAYRVNGMAGLPEAIAAGIGLGLVPCFIGDQHKGIKRIGPLIPTFGAGMWILTHPDLRHAARVRAFMDYAGAELAKLKKLLTGER